MLFLLLRRFGKLWEGYLQACVELSDSVPDTMRPLVSAFPSSLPRMESGRARGRTEEKTRSKDAQRVGDPSLLEAHSGEQGRVPASIWE